MTQSLWKEFLDIYETYAFKNPILVSILRQARLGRVEGGAAYIVCTSAPMRKFFEERKTEVDLALSTYFKRSVQAIYEIQEITKKIEEPLLSFEPSIEDLFTRAGLLSRYRFDNFAVSTSNSVAFAASQAVSKNPGIAYNPLFFYGGVGVGKTHLAQAIGRTILEANKEARVLFCPGDRFTNELIESIQNKSTARFRKKYRSLQFLAVDDIQFIAGKQTVQEEFFHTFNSVISGGGQIVLTSDRPPHEIKNLEDRLRSRFSGGLLVDLQVPDFELRTAILLIKAKEKNIQIQIEAAKVVAEQLTDSRALEGALVSLYARVIGKKEDIDLNDVASFFQNPTEKRGLRITPHDVLHAVSLFYGIKQSALKSIHRSDAIALPRQVAMYVLRKELRLKFEEIAVLLKRKDHTTIMHGYEKISSLCLKDPLFKIEIDRIVQSLSS